MKKINETQFEINEFPGNMKHFQFVEFKLELNDSVKSPDDFKLGENFNVGSGFTIVSKGVVQTDLVFETLHTCPIKAYVWVRCLSKISRKFIDNCDPEKYHRAMYDMITPSGAILWGEVKTLIHMMIPKMLTHQMTLPVLYFGSLSKEYYEKHVPGYVKEPKKIEGWHKHKGSHKMHFFNINGHSVCGKWRIIDENDLDKVSKSKCKICLNIARNKAKNDC